MSDNSSEAGIGRLIQDQFEDSRIFPGTNHAFLLFIPTEYDGSSPAALVVTTDQKDYSAIMSELIREKKMPVSIGIFVASGQRKPLRDGAFLRSARSQEYDALGAEYPNFVIDELIPYIKEKYKLNLTADPDLCMATGSSSGGITAWKMAWERNDVFRRVMIFSPTFCAFRGGDAFPAMIRKYETKKIRCFMTAGTEDMRNSAGEWYLEALRADRAMEYAGYDYSFTLIPGGEHGCGNWDHDYVKKAMAWCWETPKVQVRRLAPRIADLVSLEYDWEKYQGAMPEKNKLASTVVPETVLQKFPAYAIAPDRARLYTADPARRFVFAWSIQNDGNLKNMHKFGHLDLADDFCQPGAADIETDIQDRVYAATELGIQTFSSQSEHNCILTLPGNPAVRKIVLTAGNTPYMYAECADGTIFRRRWLVPGVAEDTPAVAPATTAF